MESLAALGLCCNILDLIQVALKCVKAVKQLRDDASTDGHASLVSQAETIGAVVTGLDGMALKLGSGQSAVQKQLRKLIISCKTSCEGVQEIMAKCRPAQEGSWRSAGMAGIRILLHKSDIEKLSNEIEACRGQLAILLATDTHEKVAHIQAQLNEFGLQASQIATRLQYLDKELKPDHDESQNHLGQQVRQIVAALEEAQDSVKENEILSQLAFSGMDSRFNQVQEAEVGTFRWIFDDPDNVQESHPELEQNFSDWLRQGSGVFHIVGKPGSGKSTLMKFLCGERETEDFLQEWAQADGKQLIFAKFFFWKSTAIAEQKTLKGLLRGILHECLAQIPSLVPRVFPQFWDEKSRTKSSKVMLSDRIISSAFDLLMTETATEGYRLCFFIDGLDEFEQDLKLQRETHYTLAKKLHKWAETSGGNVKMCVSSRPLPEFVNTFPENLRLHLCRLTWGDIRTLVITRLGNNELFEDIYNQGEEYETRCEALITKILYEARGVFLWVALILHELERCLAAGDSLEMLERRVNTAPRDMIDFVRSILESIPDRYRQGSLFTFAVVMRIAGIGLTGTILPGIENLDTLSVKPFPPFLPLGARILSIFDAADAGKLLDFDHNLAKVLSRKQNSPWYDSMAAVLASRCRGLLQWGSEGHLVSFAHRSIPEALQDIFDTPGIKLGLSDADVFTLILWVSLSASYKRCITTAPVFLCMQEDDLTGRNSSLISGIVDNFSSHLPVERTNQRHMLFHTRDNNHFAGLVLQCALVSGLEGINSTDFEVLCGVAYCLDTRSFYNRRLGQRLVDMKLTAHAPMEFEFPEELSSDLPFTTFWLEFLSLQVFFPCQNEHSHQIFSTNCCFLLMMGADPELWFSFDEEKTQGVITGPGGRVLLRAFPGMFGEGTVPTSEQFGKLRQPVSFVDLLKAQRHEEETEAYFIELIEAVIDKKYGRGKGELPWSQEPDWSQLPWWRR